MSNNYQTINQRQRYVQQSGRNWERFVQLKVNTGLESLGSDLKVIDGKEAKNDLTLREKLSIPVGNRRSNQKIWGDTDLVVVDKKRNPFAVISCKTSLHGRFSETLFYAVVLKNLLPTLKFVFSTPDKGRQQQKSPWQSEWGNEKRPTKDRLLGSHYLDGVYIENKNTNLGGAIKPLDELARDLVRWRNARS
ncbi:MAG: BsaWI family type II restriction enzyme [Patescibacteria group bacterium]